MRYFFIFFIVFTLSCNKDEHNIALQFVVNPDSITDNKSVFSTIEAALEASRKHADKRKLIKIAKGPYYLDESIILNEKDNGLTITGDGKNTIIYGGIKIEGWKKEGQFFTSTIQHQIPEGYSFKVLEVNGKFAGRSRLPQEGYFKHQSKFDIKWMSTTEGVGQQATLEELTRMIVSPSDIEPWKDDFENAELTVMHEWDETLVKIKEIDTVNNIVHFSYPVAYAPGAFDSENYCVWNTKAGLTSPGQWYYNKEEKKIYYYPAPGENPNTLEVICPVVENIIKIEDACDIQIQNLDFRATISPMILGGFGAKWFDGALSIKSSQNSTFKNLRFSSLSATAIKGLQCDSMVISDCYFKNTGGPAIRIIGSHNKITNNLIHDVGLVYPSSIALYCNVTDPNAKEEWERGKNCGNLTISHNEIFNTPYTAIACGGKNTTISFNKIHKAMRVLRDGSGIYITFCNNLLLTNNFVFDIESGKPTSAYYLDENTSNSVMKNNLAINTSRPVHTHLSKNNLYQNNVFICKNSDAVISFQRCDSISFVRNVIVADNSVYFQQLSGATTIENNISFAKKNGKSKSKAFLVEGVETTEITNQKGFVNQNPEIVQFKNGKVSFAQNSVARTLKIKDIDVSIAGTKTEINK